MKSFKVNGVTLTKHEVFMLQMGDVEDTNELRDVAVLRARMETAGFARSHRLQKQIDSMQGDTERADLAGASQPAP